MKKLFLLFWLCSCFSFPVHACLNYYYTLDKNGELHYAGEGSDLLRAFNTNFNKELIVSKMKKLDAQMEQDHSMIGLSDYAVDLLKLGRVNEALDILVELYANSPNEYKLASNLGTAYELHGDIDSALKYIRRGIELNPDDHGGSEWIHVKILETKKKVAADAAWLNTHSVLELTEVQKNDSVVGRQLLIQLQERFPFAPGPDVMMASMFEDLGDISANTHSIEYAKVLYNIAREYYGNKSEALAEKIKQVQSLAGKYAAVQPPNDPYDRIEGDNAKLGSISYKTLLSDNDPDHYQVDWTKIIYDPATLLAKVNLTLKVKEAREKAAIKPKESAAPDTSAEKPVSELQAGKTRRNIIWGSVALFILGSGVVVLGRKKRFKRFRD